MKTVNARVFLNTIEKMYPVVKAMVDDLCEVAKREMKEKNDGDLGSWKLAVMAHGKPGVGMVRMPLSLFERCTPVLPPHLPEGQE